MSDVLELPGLRLRPWEPDDARDLLAAFGDPDIRGRSVSVVDTAAAAARFVAVRAAAWAERSGVSWAVTSSSTGTVLGHVGVHILNRDLDCGMVGYWLLARARGRGVATEAVRGASAYAFGHLDLHRIELSHALENTASCAVAQRAGFSYEGTLRDAMRYPGGRWSTEHLHARLSTDLTGDADVPDGPSAH